MGPAPLAWTVTAPVAGSAETVPGGVLSSSTAVSYSSSGLAYASPQAFLVFSGAALYSAIALCSAGSPGIVSQRAEHEVVGRVDRMADAEPFLRIEEGGVLAFAVVVVGRAVFGGIARAVQLLGGVGDEVDRLLARPLRDRAGRVVGGGEQDGEHDRQQGDDAEGDEQLFDEVIWRVGAAPRPGVVGGAQEAHDPVPVEAGGAGGQGTGAAGGEGTVAAAAETIRAGERNRRRRGQRRFAILDLKRRYDPVAAHEQHVRADECTTATGSSSTW